MTKPILTFDFYNLERDDLFHFGKLKIKSSNGNLKFQATSGLANFQDVPTCWMKGRGSIPPCNLISIPFYNVDTTPIHMPKTRGIEGNFYRIFPFSNYVKTSHGVYTRGDFGIHQDVGVKGTAGCIGITKGLHWKLFEIEMQRLKLQGFNSVDLFVPPSL